MNWASQIKIGMFGLNFETYVSYQGNGVLECSGSKLRTFEFGKSD